MEDISESAALPQELSQQMEYNNLPPPASSPPLRADGPIAAVWKYQ